MKRITTKQKRGIDMPQGNPKPGELYCHFKQKMYQVLTVAEHSETKEPLVIYQALYGGFKTYARPLDMFISLVDRNKYPQVKQQYRFQLTEAEKEPELKASNQTKPADIQPDGPQEKLMAFFDADTMEEKYKILITMEECITDHLINNMAVVLDLVIEGGPVDQRFEELKRCLRTVQRYESSRLR